MTFLPTQSLNKQKYCLQIIFLLILVTAPLDEAKSISAQDEAKSISVHYEATSISVQDEVKSISVQDEAKSISVPTIEGTPATTSVPVTPGIWNQELTVTEIEKKTDDKQQSPPPEMRRCKTMKPKYVKKNLKYFFICRFYDWASFDSRFPSEAGTGLKTLDVHDHSYATPIAGHSPISVSGDLDVPGTGKEDFPYIECFVSR